MVTFTNKTNGSKVFDCKKFNIESFTKEIRIRSDTISNVAVNEYGVKWTFDVFRFNEDLTATSDVGEIEV